MADVEPIYSGERLAEILEELVITPYRLAKTIGVTPRHINEIVRCRRAITADTALRMERALGMTAESWLDSQRLYDLDHARAMLDDSDIEPLVATGYGGGKPALSSAANVGEKPDVTVRGVVAFRLWIGLSGGPLDGIAKALVTPDVLFPHPPERRHGAIEIVVDQHFALPREAKAVQPQTQTPRTSNPGTAWHRTPIGKPIH